MQYLPLIVDAVKFAAEQHRDQRRKDSVGAPYINHPLDLVHVLVMEGLITDVTIIVGAILHDVIEDTGATWAQLSHRFGTDVANVVVEVSDDKSLPKNQRKLLQIVHASHVSIQSKAVKIADKTCNIRDLLRDSPVGWSQQRISDYFNFARAVVNQARGIHTRLDNAFDVSYNEGVNRKLVIPDFTWESEAALLMADPTYVARDR